MDTTQLDTFAKSLGVKPRILIEARVTRDSLRKCWTMPIYTARGEVAGTWRYYDYSGGEDSARGSAPGFLWCPSQFDIQGVVVVVSSMLSVLACASRGFNCLGLTSDSAACTASIYDLIRSRRALVAYARPSSEHTAQRIAERLAVFASTRIEKVLLEDYLNLDAEDVYDHGHGVRGRLLPDWRDAC